VQRKRQAKRERDADGAPQHRHPRRHALLDIAAAAHSGGSDGEAPGDGSPAGAAGGMGRQHPFGGLSDPLSFAAAGAFGGAGGAHLGAAHLAAASGALQLQQQSHTLAAMLGQGADAPGSPLRHPSARNAAGLGEQHYRQLGSHTSS
jgi:hypothetical protein